MILLVSEAEIKKTNWNDCAITKWWTAFLMHFVQCSNVPNSIFDTKSVNLVPRVRLVTNSSFFHTYAICLSCLFKTCVSFSSASLYRVQNLFVLNRWVIGFKGGRPNISLRYTGIQSFVQIKLFVVDLWSIVHKYMPSLEVEYRHAVDLSIMSFIISSNDAWFKVWHPI